MALTPTTLIAIAGLSQGTGLAINSNMTSAMSQVVNSSIVTTIANLRVAPNIGNVVGLTDTINSLPYFINNSASVVSTVTTHAQGILPETSVLGLKDFILLFNSVASFVATNAEVASALAEYKNETFGNLGIGVTNYNQVITSGVPNNLIAVGPYLKNFGILYDFTDLTTVGTPQSLVMGLQAAGFGDTLGINRTIVSSGYDPTMVKNIPSSVLTAILTNVSGSNLINAVALSHSTPVKTVNNAAELLLIETFIPQDVVETLGLSAVGSDGLKQLANKLLNLGVQGDNYKLGNFLANVENPSLTHLGTLTSVIPATVASTIGSTIGTGVGPFGNPLIQDLIGTVAGLGHNDNFTTVVNSINTIQGNTLGAYLIANAATLSSAIAAATDPGSDPATLAANIAFFNSVQNFNSAIAGTSPFATAATNANQSLTKSLSQVATENSNLSRASISLYSGTTTDGVGSSDFMSFGRRLHDFGVDGSQLGYNIILENIVTDDQAGDAIRACLAEGRNLTNSQKNGKTTPHVANYYQSLKTV